MICKSCGFEADDGELCPICGGTLAEPEAPAPEAPLPEGPEPLPEKPKPAKKSGSLTVKLTAVICAVTILCTAAVGAMIFISSKRTDDAIAEAVLRGYEIGRDEAYWNGYSQGYNNGLEESDVYTRNLYENISRYAGNGEKEAEYPDGKITLTDYSTTKDTLSADREMCMVTVKFELTNTTDKAVTLTSLNCMVYTPDMYYSSSYFGEGSSLFSSQFPSDDNGDAVIEPNGKIPYEVTYMCPKSDSVTATVSFANDESRYNVDITFNIEF